jgi:hypothetical protein
MLSLKSKRIQPECKLLKLNPREVHAILILLEAVFQNANGIPG